MQHPRCVGWALGYLMLVILVQAVALPLIFDAGTAAIWLTIYFCLAAIALALSILGMDAPAGSHGQVELLLLDHARKVYINNKWHRRFALVGDFLLNAVAWPYMVIYWFFLLLRKPDLILGDLRSKLRLRTSCLQVLYPPMVFLSIWFALVSIAMHVLAQIRGNEPAYFDFVASMVIIAVGLKHVLHLVGPATYQEMLRKAKAPVALNYIASVVCDLVALILCYNIVLSTLTSGIPPLVGVKDIYDRLNGFKDVFALAFDRPKERIDYALGISGLLWLITLAKDMLNLKGYKRTAIDRCARGFCLALCGFEADAKAEIETLSPDSDSEIKMLAESYAILGDHLKSLRLTERFVLRKGEDHDVKGISNAILLMNEMLYHGSEPERLARTIVFLENHGLDSVQLILAAISTDPAEFAQALKAGVTSDRLLLAKAYVLWETGDRRDGFVAFKRLAKAESEKPSGGDAGQEKSLDLDEACKFAVYLMMLEGLVDTDEELASEVEKGLAEYAGPVHRAIEAEVRFTLLFSLSWILTMAADRMKGRIADVAPVLRLADVAFARIETTSLTEPFRKVLIGLRSRIQPVETVKEHVSAATAIGRGEVLTQGV